MKDTAIIFAFVIHKGRGNPLGQQHIGPSFLFYTKTAPALLEVGADGCEVDVVLCCGNVDVDVDVTPVRTTKSVTNSACAMPSGEVVDSCCWRRSMVNIESGRRFHRISNVGLAALNSPIAFFNRLLRRLVWFL